MVKKKAPFIPITIVVIGLGFILAINARSHPVDPAAVANRPQDLGSQDHPKADPDSISNILKPLAKKRKIGGPIVANGAASSGDLDPMRLIRPVKYKPTYNPTTAQQHWYLSN